MKRGRRNEKGKKLAGKAAARALVWLLLPVLVFVVLNSDHMPQVPLQATTLYLVGHAPPPSPASSDQTPGEAVDAPPSPTSRHETPGKVVGAPPSPTTSDQTPSVAVDAPPSVASRDEAPGDAIGANKSQGDVARRRDTDVAAPRSKSICDFSSERMDVCAMQGDVRMHGKSATVYVVSASDDSYRPENGTVKIRPYPRKSEEGTMRTIREVTIRWSGLDAPRCTVTHNVPAVVFSTGAYLSNFFHAMTDGIIPLFNTVREYDGHVQLVVTDYNHKWVDKFKDILAALSKYPVINFDADDKVRCFPSVQVGTEGHKEMGIIPALSRKGYTMTDFRNFLRSVYSLKQVVNSCDVMVGVHGAGLTNLVFLPRNATLVQVVPWGDMSWGSNAAFGAPSADMGLGYVQYETTPEETTLKYKYPRDHAVFTDVASINRQGYGMTWGLFLNGQNITLDIDRYRGVLQKIYHDSIMGDPSFNSGPVVEAPPSSASSGETPGDVLDGNRDLQNEKGLQALNAGVDAPLIKSGHDAANDVDFALQMLTVTSLKHLIFLNRGSNSFVHDIDVATPRSKSICDFSSERMDICAMQGDVRMHGKSATVYVVSVSDDSYRPENGMVKIRPYPRKSEEGTMQTIREVTIRWNGLDAPRCTVTHDVPAVVFSTGAYLSNFFHAMTDGVIPLFNTVREYDGHVQLVITDYNRKWVDKFQRILAVLSKYPVINFDADDKGYTMTDFRNFLRSVYSLKREWATPVNRTAGDRPRLLMVLRRKSRTFANEAEAVAAAIEVGFEVVSAEPQAMSDMARFAEVVNSCDVMVGVHGAVRRGRELVRRDGGRAWRGAHQPAVPPTQRHIGASRPVGLVFLPRNATLVQVVPWGDMSWGSNAAFGAPSADMGLRYVQYETTPEETTLKYKYPRDHAIFTDVASINRQGYGMTWELFLNGQNITLDINRYRGVLQQIYHDSIMVDTSAN
uniref:Glycosyltransferase 61 catalytic domain-containing protein n=1 Tax=Aegilops tauschii TaxID=37682 RepID=M8C7B6_AEGTA